MGGGAVGPGCKAGGDVTETDDAPGWDAIDGIPGPDRNSVRRTVVPP
jgi:hypothetical protein